MATELSELRERTAALEERLETFGRYL